jgi:multiple sugar transport system substrate-binding protein
VLVSLRSSEQYQTPFYQQAAEAVGASECRPWFGSLMDVGRAQETIMDVVYRLIKQDPTLDIATELQKAQEEFNSEL